MKPIILGTISMGMVAALFAGPVNAADDWHFSLTPYLWNPAVDSQTKYGIPPGAGGSPNVEADRLSLDFALMLAGEARKGRWSVLGDVFYLDYSGSGAKTVSVNLPGGGSVPVLDAGTRTSLKGGLYTLAPGYSVYSTPKANMDVFGGVRYLPIKAKVDWRITGPVGAFSASGTMEESTDLLDGIIGVRGRAKLGESKWSLPYYFDVGTGSSHLTWQANVGVSYSYGWGDLRFAYRHVKYDFGADKFLQNISFSGPALGAAFHF